MTKDEKEYKRKNKEAIEKIYISIIQYLYGNKANIKYKIEAGLKEGRTAPKSKVIIVQEHYEFPKLIMYFGTGWISYAIKSHFDFPCVLNTQGLVYYYTVDYENPVNIDDFIVETTDFLRNLIRHTKRCNLMLGYNDKNVIPAKFQDKIAGRDYLENPYSLLIHEYTYLDKEAVKLATELMKDSQYRRICGV